MDWIFQLFCFSLSKKAAKPVILNITCNSAYRVWSLITPQKQRFVFQFLSYLQHFGTSFFKKNFKDFSVFFLKYYAPAFQYSYWGPQCFLFVCFFFSIVFLGLFVFWASLIFAIGCQELTSFHSVAYFSYYIIFARRTIITFFMINTYVNVLYRKSFCLLHIWLFLSHCSPTFQLNHV